MSLGYPNIAHYKISNRVSHFFFLYLLVFDRISDSMSLNKMPRTSSRNIGQQHQNTAVMSLYTWGTSYPCVHQTHLECLLLKSYIFVVTFDHRSQSHLKFQLCLTTEYAVDRFLVKAFFLIFFIEALPNHVVMEVLFDNLCKFSVPETQSLSAILQLWPLKSLWPLKLSFSRALG